MFGNMTLRLAFILIVAAFFIIFPIYSLVGLGPFSWHITQPEARQGGLELLFLFGFFYYSLTISPSFKKYAFFLIPAFLYTRRHGVDLSIVTLYVYIEAIFSLGWMLLPYIGGSQDKRRDNYLLGGFVGVTVWLLIIWVFSLVGFGSVKAIQILAFSILGCALLFGNAPRLVVSLYPWLRVKKPYERASVALILTLFCALFAKISSASIINFDSMWYGLQLEKSMLGEGSLYANQGLVALVHYYPKLYESLLIPFSGLDSLSLPMGLSVFSWLLVVLTSFVILREFRVNLTLSTLITSLVATIPAFGSIAMTTKGDAFSAWLGLLGLFFLLRFRKTGYFLWFWASLSSAAFAPLARLSVLPYIAILIVFLFFTLFDKQSHKLKTKLPNLHHYVLPTLAGFVVALVLGRSIYLTGVPFIAPNELVRLANHFGMTLNYPIGNVSSDISLRIPVFWGIWSYLFNPANVSMLLITWIGNVWVFLPVAAIALSTRWQEAFSREKLPFLLIGLAFPVILFTTRLPSQGADGNYFIFPIICLLIFGAFMLNTVFCYVEKWLGATMLAFAVASSAVIFVTADWGPGTRAIDLVFNRLPFELDTKRTKVINFEKISDIYNYFKIVPANSRVFGFDSRNPPIGWWLPVRYEPIDIIAILKPELISSSLNFKNFLINTKIDYILLSKSSKYINTSFLDARIKLKDENLAVKILEMPVSRNHSIRWWLSVQNNSIDIVDWSRTELINPNLNSKSIFTHKNIDNVRLSRNNPYIASSGSENIFLDVINELKNGNLASKTFDNSTYEIWKLSTHIPSLHARIKMKDEGKIDISLDPSTGCDNQSNLLAKVKWSFPKIETVRIEIKAKTTIMSTLWVEGGGEGDATTGKWVAKGTEFIFRKKSDNSELAKAIIYGCDVD